MEPHAVHDVYTDRAIPYTRSPRYQPLFTPEFIAYVASLPANDTGWTPGKGGAIPAKIIGLARDASVKALRDHFSVGKEFDTKLGKVTVTNFETQWDAEAGIFRFGKLFFALNGEPIGSFVTRASSNDPTAVQIFEARETDSAGKRLDPATVQAHYNLIGGLVLTEAEKLDVLIVDDVKGSGNMEAIMRTVNRYRTEIQIQDNPV
jgi:hypothetical protein